ncbi:hypothetical protein JCM24511_02965 [Saitozyma sp. JCM 24511]|nr:hypothetical protein JCM24511_02965 [Saitozyma sp. JCM 24511]
MAIFDAYPKAKYHFLVLPRYPFPPRSNPESRSSIVKLDHLDSLRTLLLKTTADVREQVIGALADTAQEVEEMIRDEMIKTEGFEWGINIGFHAIPSMKHVHVHVISEDRMSDKLKTKKHYNSFRPDLGFFVSLRDVQHWIEDGDDQSIRQHIESLDSAEALLDTPLMCFKCDEPEHNMPSLKKHLEKEYEKEKKTALKRIAERGRQRSSDEDMF